MMRRWIAPLTPVLLGGVAALVWALTRSDHWLVVSVSLPWLLLGLGAIGSAIVLGWRWLRTKQTRRIDQAEARVHEDARLSRQRFMRRLDHELKNPVTAIRTALAAEDSESPALAVVGTQARRLSSLVADLAKLADLESRELERVPLELPELLGEVIELLPPTEREIRAFFPKVPWKLPTVVGDPDLLSVVFYNLLSNSVKYSDPGATIEVRGSDADDAVQIEVSDTGWGIDGDDLALVWEELARGSRGRAVEGSGLGLSIVKVIVERHGGEVALRSEPGVGTRIVVRLPAQPSR